MTKGDKAYKDAQDGRKAFVEDPTEKGRLVPNTRKEGCCCRFHCERKWKIKKTCGDEVEESSSFDKVDWLEGFWTTEKCKAICDDKGKTNQCQVTGALRGQLDSECK